MKTTEQAGQGGAKPENFELRKLLALSYCPSHLLYTDDGELQDNREHPFIDFKRDSPDQIFESMKRRTLSTIAAAPTPGEPQ